MQAALAHSIPLKKAECCLPNMAIWGRISTLNGRDYIIAQSTPNPRMESGAAVPSTLYFMTQDGVTWADLPDATPAHHDIAAHMRDMLQGDPTHKHFWPPKPAEDDEEAAGGDEGAPRAEHKAITELQRLRTMIEDIAASTTLAPVGSQVVNADDCIIANPLFPGLEYPDKLEAYYHQHRGPNSAPRAPVATPAKPCPSLVPARGASRELRRPERGGGRARQLGDPLRHAEAGGGGAQPALPGLQLLLRRRREHLGRLLQRRRPQKRGPHLHALAADHLGSKRHRGAAMCTCVRDETFAGQDGGGVFARQ